MTTTEPDRTTEEAEAMGITRQARRLHHRVGGDRGPADQRAHHHRIRQQRAPGARRGLRLRQADRPAHRGPRVQAGAGHHRPGKLEDVFGGGICQVSTTLFNAAFFAGLEIVERKNHSIYIDHYPKGRDATVSAGGPNMRFRNDTEPLHPGPGRLRWDHHHVQHLRHRRRPQGELHHQRLLRRGEDGPTTNPRLPGWVRGPRSSRSPARTARRSRWCAS